MDVDLRYPDNVVDSLTTNHFNRLFNGSEIVVAGRLMDNDLNNFLVEVHGQGVRRLTLTLMMWLLCLVMVLNGQLLSTTDRGRLQCAGPGNCSGLGCHLPWWPIHLWGFHRAPVGLPHHPAAPGQKVSVWLDWLDFQLYLSSGIKTVLSLFTCLLLCFFYVKLEFFVPFFDKIKKYDSKVVAE